MGSSKYKGLYNQPGNAGVSPLAVALQRQHIYSDDFAIQIVDEFDELCINTRDHLNWSALHWSCAFKKMEIFKSLLKIKEVNIEGILDFLINMMVKQRRPNTETIQTFEIMILW